MPSISADEGTVRHGVFIPGVHVRAVKGVEYGKSIVATITRTHQKHKHLPVHAIY